MKRMMREILWLPFDALFPSVCAHCGTGVSRIDCHLCARCRSTIEPCIDACPVCGGEIADDRCTVCSDRKLYFKQHVSVSDYQGAMKSVLYRLKYKGDRRLVYPLAEMAAFRVDALPHFDAVTYIPMKPRKVWKRGFNQARLLAQLLARYRGVPCCTLLKEHPRAKIQKELHYQDRFLNILGRYVVLGSVKRMKGKAVLLVDDVFTTGATVNECARVLTQAGVGEVYVLTIARTKIKRLESENDTGYNKHSENEEAEGDALL